MSGIEIITEPATGSAIAQKLVHKSDADEVFLTFWRRTGPDSFSVTAHWPSDRPFYRAADGGFEPLLVTETVRQLFPLICHVGYDTPFDHHLVWESYRYELDPAVLRCDGGPIELELRVVCSELVHRRSHLAGMTMDVDLLRDGNRLASACSRFTVQAHGIYVRLRGGNSDSIQAMAAAPAAPEGISAEYAGRPDRADVVLSDIPPGGRPEAISGAIPEPIPEAMADGMPEAAAGNLRAWWLRVDTAHRKFFDHPVDHAPGMLLLEAARQAARAALHPLPALPVAMSAAFHRYVDLDAPCRITARVESPALVRVTAEQHGRLCFTADVGAA
ncbi:AfsA-related hotdog domain-containing protein [Kitasatospora aureofaciens]|uniref:AfsA-related hotdog domain-containing protein n=1 Tax=Kitasatospora aureofaciens TaxID=1894 RepID=UPI003823B0DE